ncbi:hypothetical protein BD560DRAFT_494441 [Blakeslea trispora]|nr:hypothetical protein BD560DRAFT_494441 [Blakeslea trispora]
MACLFYQQLTNLKHVVQSESGFYMIGMSLNNISISKNTLLFFHRQSRKYTRDMKLALSALFVLGLSQLCTLSEGYSTKVVVRPAVDQYQYDFACLQSSFCGGEFCVEVQLRTPDSSGLPSTDCPVATPYSISPDRNTLDFLHLPFGTVFLPCHFDKLVSEGTQYICSDEQNNAVIPTTIATTTTAIPTCLSNSDFGKKKGNGYNGDCCKTEADCKDDCIKGKCNGPKKTTAKSSTTKKTTAKIITAKIITTKSTTTKSTTTKSTTTKQTATKTPSACKSGFLGKKNGKGLKGVCCNTHWDCIEGCTKGVCT